MLTHFTLQVTCSLILSDYNFEKLSGNSETRKRTFTNQLYLSVISSRLILGAYIGRPMLTYRRPIDIFKRLIALRSLNLYETFDPETLAIITAYVTEEKSGNVSRQTAKAYKNCIKDLKQNDLRQSYFLANRRQ
jgi:hypothetical protein